MKYMFLLQLTILLPLYLQHDQQELDDPPHTVILYGGSWLGYYYINIYLGTPPKKQTVIVDTGSTITTLPCTECPPDSCGKHIDEKFDFKGSKTSVWIKCHEKIGETECSKCKDEHCSFYIGYSEKSSLSGFYIKDQILIGDWLYQMYEDDELKNIIALEQFQTTFGCTTQETNLFKTQDADGIMGLSPLTNSTSHFPNYVDDLYRRESRLGVKLQFSMCFGIDGGYMSFGGYDYSRHQHGAQTYTVNYTDTNNLYKINIGNTTLELDEVDFQLGEGTFVDSGTTLIYGHGKIHEQFITKMKEHCQSNQCFDMKVYSNSGMCFKYNTSEFTLDQYLEHFPVITFKIDHFDFKWRPQDYLNQRGPEEFCIPILNFDNFGQGKKFILGGVFMRNQDILFDRGSKSLSFTRSNCSNSVLTHHYSIQEKKKLIELFEDIKTDVHSEEDKSDDNEVKGKDLFQTLKIFVAVSIFGGFFLLSLFLFLWKKKLKRNQLNSLAKELGELSNKQTNKQNIIVIDDKLVQGELELRANDLNNLEDFSFNKSHKMSDAQSMDTSVNYGEDQNFHFDLDLHQGMEELNDLEDGTI